MKKVFYAIIALIALYFILCLFGPRTVKAERSVSINAPADQIKHRLGDFQYFHDRWNPWAEKDPAMKVAFHGTPAQPGHLYKWEGNDDVGKGEMVLERFSGDSVVQTLRFDNQGDSRAYFIVNDKGQSSDVIWGLTFDVPFLQRTPMLFINMESMIGHDYERGLSRLKQAIESETQQPASANL